MRNRFRNKSIFVAIFSLLFSFCILLTGCGNGTRVVLTTGFAKDVLFTLNDETCTLPEYMVYLTNVQNQYESIYGPEIWNAQLDGVTLEDNVKDTVLARIAQVKTMYLLAVKKDMSLSEEEEALCATAGLRYYDELTSEQVGELGLTEDVIINMYREYALADGVYEAIISEINPEISDDDARTVVVQHIFIATSVTSGAGTVVAYDQEKKAQLYDYALDLKNRAQEGEDFEMLALENSDEDVITLSFGRGVMDTVIENAVFSLETGGISNVLENDAGYHIFKCISTLNRAETEANRLAMIEGLRQDAFEAEYDTFASSLLKNLNDELWNKVELNQDNSISVDFFEIYEDVFGK